jgi:hypothetical protein
LSVSGLDSLVRQARLGRRGFAGSGMEDRGRQGKAGQASESLGLVLIWLGRPGLDLHGAASRGLVVSGLSWDGQAGSEGRGRA